MITKQLLYPFIVAISVFSIFVAATEASKSNQIKDEGQHEEEHGHDGHESEETEEGGKVGPNKGILEANEHTGFKLSPEALKNFDLRLMRLSGKGPWMIPKTAIVRSGEEVNLFRLRNGFFKRIDFQIARNSESQVEVNSDDLRLGDSIVLVGLGFLRIAELSAFGGVAEGHSH